MRRFLKQSSFSKGVLSPKGYALTNIKQYNHMAKTIKNFTPTTLGGVKKRFGTKFVADVSTRINSITELKPFVYQYDVNNFYTLVFKPLEMEIFYNETLLTTKSTPYTADDIPNIISSIAGKSVYVVDGNHQAYELVGTVSSSHPATFTFTAWDFDLNPVWDYDKDYLDSTIAIAKKSGTNNTAELTVSSGTFVFENRHVGGLYLDVKGNKVRMDTLISSTRMDGEILNDSLTAATLKGKQIIIGEPIFSATRGWPKSVSSFQSRLTFGGNDALPSIVAASKTNYFKNFDETDTLADSALVRNIGSNDTNEIEHLVSNKSLIALTTNGIFATPLFGDQAANPSQFFLMQQGSDEGIANVKPAIYDGGIIYSLIGGKTIKSLGFDINNASYDSTNISFLSEHLIKNPTDMGSYHNPTVDDSSYLILINEDGSGALLQSNKNEGIQAWTEMQTEEGEFGLLSSAQNEVYFINIRNISGTTKYYLEKLDMEKYFDCEVEVTNASPSTTLKGLGHLNGLTVGVRGTVDGETSYVGEFEVVASEITGLPYAVDSASVGINIESELTMLKPGRRASSNPYLNMHVTTAYVDYYESLGIKVNGYDIPSLKFGTSILGQAPSLQSGVYEFSPMQGFNTQDDLKITHEIGMPCYIRGVSRIVEVA